MKFDAIETELLAAIVEGPFETPLWHSFLDRLRSATLADFASLSFRRPGRPFEEEVMLISGAEEVTVETIDFDELPGEPPAEERLTEGRPYTFDELHEMANPQTQAFLSYIISKGLTQVYQVRVQEKSGVHGWLTITGGKHDFGPREKALLERIVPALRLALRYFVALERERFNAIMTAEPARRLHFGWLLLDRTGRILDADDQGAHALHTSGVIWRQRNGRLGATASPLDREISDAIAQIANDANCRPFAITLTKEPLLDMLLLPTRRKSIAADGSPAVIAYIHGDSWKTADRCEQLAQLFKLTPQEARLALALCRGMTIAEAAEDMALSVGTARNYSKKIFAKIGARGQSDLVRIFMRSVLAVAPEV